MELRNHRLGVPTQLPGERDLWHVRTLHEWEPWEGARW